MEKFFQTDIETLLQSPLVTNIAKVLMILIITMPILLLLRRWAQAFFTKKYAPHYGMLASKTTFYTGFVLIIVTIMQQLGFSLAPLLGAAGIVGVALGFASQTSVSNVISGLFLIAEQSFKVDDIITVGETTGIVLSIDVLSVKLRTFDNKLVRIPNETIIKTQVINNTRFPIRRFNASVAVAYKENIARVREVLMEVAEKNPYALREPEPVILFDGFGTSSIDLLFLVWAQTTDWIRLKDTLQEEIKKSFEREGIEIPFPHVSVYAGSATNPLPLHLTRAPGESDEEQQKPRGGQ